MERHSYSAGLSSGASNKIGRNKKRSKAETLPAQFLPLIDHSLTVLGAPLDCDFGTDPKIPTLDLLQRWELGLTV